MLSFVLSSLYRYRAGLLDRIESSEMSLILEIFGGESDAIVLPGLRHLLYGRPLFMSRVVIVQPPSLQAACPAGRAGRTSVNGRAVRR